MNRVQGLYLYVGIVLHKAKWPMFSEEQICHNTTLDDIWGVHTFLFIFVLPDTKLLFKKLQPKQQQQ